MSLNTDRVDVEFSGRCECGRTVEMEIEAPRGSIHDANLRRIKCRECRRIVPCTPSRSGGGSDE